MKKLIVLDWSIVAMLETEAETFEVSSSCICRVAILEYLCRSHQARFPFIFRNEKMLSDFQKKCERIYEVLRCTEGKEPVFFSAQRTPQEFYSGVYCEMLDLLREERKRLNLPSHQNKPN